MKLLGIYLEVLLVNINKLAWLSECFSMFYTSFSHSHTKGQNYECSFKGNIPHTLTHTFRNTLLYALTNKHTYSLVLMDKHILSMQTYNCMQVYGQLQKHSKL